jgi:hypothetical protein
MRRKSTREEILAKIAFHEKNKKQAFKNCNTDETLHKRSVTVSVTPPDTDTDTDKGTNVPSSEPPIGDSAPSVASCPHQDILHLYHESLPELKTVVYSRWSGSKDADALRARWREDKRHQSLDFWQRFFATVRTNSHWMGKGQSGWSADLRWLVKRSNFDKVVDLMVDNAHRDAAHG